MKPIQWKTIDLLAAGVTQGKAAAEVLKVRELKRAQFSAFWKTRAKASADERVPRKPAQTSAIQRISKNTHENERERA